MERRLEKYSRSKRLEMKAKKRHEIQQRNKSPLWDLYRDGVTYSFLNEWIIDRERARLNYVEGWTPLGESSSIAFGSLFHEALESLAGGKDYRTSLDSWRTNALKDSKLLPEEREEIEVAYITMNVLLQEYIKHWEEDKNKCYIAKEKTFWVQHTLRNGKVIPIRGRWDAIYREDGLWLQENKTRSFIDEDMIQDTLPRDLQTMLYMYAIKLTYGEVPQGVLYNVIRRPLHRKKKGETIAQFGERLFQEIQSNPNHFFMRWTVHILPQDLDNWCIRTLNPLLEQVALWWDSIKDNPFNPFSSRNLYHYERPFGIYDAIASGRGKGSYYDMLVLGKSDGYYRRKVAFPELED